MTVLELENLSVRFGGHLAVSDASLRVEGGRVTGLIGPNGAGKTTTFNAICGVVPPSSGRVLLDGKDISSSGTHQRARFGIGRTFQRLEVFGSLSVADNIRVGQEIRRSWSRGKAALPQYLDGLGDPSPDIELAAILTRLDLVELADLRWALAAASPLGCNVALARAAAQATGLDGSDLLLEHLWNGFPIIGDIPHSTTSPLR